MPDLSSLLMMGAVIVVGYFLLIRPAQKRQADQQKTMAAIEPGTRIMTTAGVYATVLHVGQSQIVVEISPGVEMTLIKAAIAKVVKPEEDEFEYDDGSADAPADGAAEHDAFGEAIKGFDAPDAADPQAGAGQHGSPDVKNDPTTDPKN